MIRFLKHLIIPHARNNHRARLLHNSSLYIVVILLLLVSCVSVVVNRVNPDVLGISYSVSDRELLILINEERIANGLPPLTINEALARAAESKAQHMLAVDYWAHFAPDGTTPWSFITKAQYDYLYAGENLAKGFTNSEAIVEAWMNSKSHRENILSPQYTELGFAILEGELEGEETVLVVQMFGKERNQFLADASNLVIPSVDSADQQGANTTVDAPLLGASGGSNSLTSEEQSLRASPVLDLHLGAKAIAYVILLVLVISLVLDFIIIERNKIPRIVGDNLDHLIVILIFGVFLLAHSIGIVL